MTSSIANARRMAAAEEEHDRDDSEQEDRDDRSSEEHVDGDASSGDVEHRRTGSARLHETEQFLSNLRGVRPEKASQKNSQQQIRGSK